MDQLTPLVSYCHPKSPETRFVDIKGKEPQWATDIKPAGYSLDPFTADDPAEQAFIDWCESTPRGTFPNCETNVAEAAGTMLAFIAGYEAAVRKYTNEE